MLRIIQNVSSAGAKTYYSTSDYYTEGQERAGVWRGEGAARLNLSGKIEQAAWESLCDNRDPSTGQTLTVRRKSERRVGYDFNFHVPKSVSLLHAVTGDERIVDAFRSAVDETMAEMEVEMKGRVRREGRNEDRITGNMVWGEFIHLTSRPVNGVPDPHLHCHAFVHNLTFDPVEQRWKAGQFGDLKRDAPYFEAVFHSKMGRKMEELGLPVERTKKGWEIAGVEKATLDKFSRRRALIAEVAEREGLNTGAGRSDLGAKTRERKNKHLSMAELCQEWRSRLTPDERSALAKVEKQIGTPAIPEREPVAWEAASLAVEHSFERKSVVPERMVIAEALKRSVGQVSRQHVEQAVAGQNLLLGERDGRRVATTVAVLAEEKAMIDFARNGRGICPAFTKGVHPFKREWLNKEQRLAVEHVLQSHDRVIVVRGAAGTGKTSMMREAVEGIEADGTKVFTFAPSANASRGVLRAEGFKDADTVARLLKDERLQQSVAGQAIWIDESGLLGTRTMAQVFNLAERLDARVILSGDRRQHGSVERGAALRLLEEGAGIVSAEIRDIQRQKSNYKQVVESLSEGRTGAALRQLDQLGWIKEVDRSERYKVLAKDYVASVSKGDSTLVICPTHVEGKSVADAIRSELQRAKQIGRDERRFTVLENANLTLAERQDEVNYLPGDVLVYHQNAPGHRKGQRVTAGDGPLPLKQASRFTAFHPNVLPLAEGDSIRITQNGKTADGAHRLNNGAVFRVNGFTDSGDIQLGNGWVVAKDFGHFTHGYVVTSHASQGRTVDRVLIAQASESFPASSQEQAYVSISRGRKRATIYTDDKRALLEAVCHSDDRLTATELLSGHDHHDRAVAIGRTQRQVERSVEPVRKPRAKERTSYER
ncbi:MAG TPA: MobF family relaxase [Tepidisphaeraceae bacterium]|jgi:conjugative relaxase-like TrwC/TraI family protein|nr:MobF family relaxase [Tepidisphaeraceae bacterium]